MSTTELRWHRLQELFHAACDLPPSQREAFAHRQASDDAMLLADLLRMIQIENDATQRLIDPLAQSRELFATAAPLPPGTRFGPWALDAPIGRGGMAQVYLAHRADGAYERQVALKLLARSSVEPLQRARIEVEQQLLAQMAHPAIAHIHDAGTDEEGRPWLVMEYIEGQSISHFCNENALSLRERVALFVRVCEGVQHAHQKGVVHRDIKPGNVLVMRIDGIPCPKLIDFGIAVVAGGPTGHAAGTPGYMSPEQADPNRLPDSRSDIYSLGALFHELVSGERPAKPHDSDHTLAPSDQLASLDDTRLKRLAGQRGLRRRHLLRVLREDLDWIALKALHPDPADRYESVSLLIEDLRRYLDGYPVKAAPARPRVAMARFIARHRAGSAAVLITAITLLGALGASGWALGKAEREANRARATADFLGNLLTSVDPDFARDLDKTLMMRVLDEASRRIDTELADEPGAKFDVELAISDSYAALGLADQSLPRLESAMALAHALSGEGGIHSLLVSQRLGTALVDSGDFAGSERVFRQAITQSEAAAPGSLPADLIPDIRSRLGWTLRQLGQTNAALAEARRGYEELKQVSTPNATKLLDAATRLAIPLADLGHYDQAIALIDDAIDQRVEDMGRDHPRLLSMRLSRAVFLLQKRDYAAAEIELKSLLDPIARQHGEQSDLLLMAHGNLGGALRQQGKIEEAGPHYRLAWEENRRRLGPDAPNTIMSRHNHANWLLDDGQTELALSEHQATLAQAEHVFGPDHPVTAEALRGLGLAHLALGRLPEARANFERSLTLLKKAFGDADGPLARIQENLATLEQAERKAASEH